MSAVMDGQSASTPKTLRGGVIPHKLTTEERRRGAETLNRRRREAGEIARMTVVELQAKAITEEAARLMKPYWDAIDSGDYRASEAIQDRILGKPTTRIESADVTEQTPFAELSGEQKRAELGRLQARLEELKQVQVADEGEGQQAISA